MRTLAGQNTNALRSITGYNVGSPLRKMPELTQNQQASAVAGGAALGTDIAAIATEGGVAPQSAKGEGGRILGETAKYASMGMAFGPIGAGVGALVGLTVGLVKNKKAKEAHKEQMAANDKANKANAAQLALAANVNSQKAPATMKSPNERNMAPNKRMEPLKRTMAPIKMAPLKKELSSMQRSSSYMRTPASDVQRQEIMRTVSGVSSLKRSEEVSYSGPQIRYGDDGEPTGVHSATKQITVFKGQPGYEKALASAQEKKNRATDAAEARAKAKAKEEAEKKTKEETQVANQRAKANAKAAKTT